MRRLAWAAGASFSLHALALLALLWQVASLPLPSERRALPTGSIEARLSLPAGAEDGFLQATSLPLRRGDDQRTVKERPSELAPSLSNMLADAETTELASAPSEPALPPSGPDITGVHVTRPYIGGYEAMMRQMEMQMRMQKIQGLWMALSLRISMSPLQAQGDCEFRHEENFEPRCSSSALRQWAHETSVRSLCMALAEEGANFSLLKISSFDHQVSVQIH